MTKRVAQDEATSLAFTTINQLCDKGTVDDLRTMLAHEPCEFRYTVHYVDQATGDTPLIRACLRTDWDVAQPMVVELLLQNANPRSADCHGFTPLHCAAQQSSAAIVKCLLGAGASVNCVNNTHYTPLHSCCVNRGDQEGVEIIRVLLDAGAKIDSRTTKGSTPLLTACRQGNAEMVELLIARGANVRDVMVDGRTALMRAAENSCFGTAIIALLVKSGANPHIVANDGDGLLASAATVEILQTIGRLIEPANQLRDVLPISGSGEPVGIMQASIPWGFVPDNTSYGYTFTKSIGSALKWAMLRDSSLPRLDGSNRDWFNVIGTATDEQVWRDFCIDMTTAGSVRHPQTGDTLLHVAARCAFEPALGIVMRFNVNPFFRNRRAELATDLARTPAARQLLDTYMTWRPETGKQFGHWCGPYFRARVFTLLCMCRRLKVQRNLHVPREIQTLLIREILKREVVFVKK